MTRNPFLTLEAHKKRLRWHTDSWSDPNRFTGKCVGVGYAADANHAGLSFCYGVLPSGALGAVPTAAAAAPVGLASMSRADQIKYKQAAQKAKVQALKQAKAEQVAAAETGGRF